MIPVVCCRSDGAIGTARKIYRDYVLQEEDEDPASRPATSCF